MSISILCRELGLGDEVHKGLGSIDGTGVFVSLGIGAGIVGPAVILAVLLAALVATANGLSVQCTICRESLGERWRL